MVQRNFITHPIIVRRLEVARVVDVTPRMRRVTLTGDQLRAFTKDNLDLPAFLSTGFDDHVKVVFADNGDIEGALPLQRAHSIDWQDAPQRQMRDYTPRRFDPVAGELDLDFVRHGTGPAAQWAERATEGDLLHIVGPKSSLVFPDNVDWMVLAGDETALPAIGRFLDERPADWPVHVVVEVRSPTARQQLQLRDGDTIHWVETAPDAPSALVEAVQQLQWWPGDAYVWAAAESSSLLPLRRWLSRQMALPKTHINVTGYWHTVAETEAVEQESVVISSAVDTDALLSPIPWFATRAALSLGILDRIDDAPTTTDTLATELSLSAGPVETLVTMLVTIGVLDRAGKTLTIGEVGSAVLGDDHLLESLDDTLEVQLLLSLAQLAPAVATGTSSFALTNRRSVLQEVTTDPVRYREEFDATLGFDFVAGAIAELPLVASSSRRAATGPGSAAVSLVLSARPLRIVESPIPLDVLRGVVREPDRAYSADFGDADLVVSALALSYRTDDEARDLLSSFPASVSSCVVIEEVPGEGEPTPHDAEHQLLALAATGSGPRRVADLAALASSAGWTLLRSTSLGWNHEALELVRAATP